MISNIVLATDGSDHATNAMNMAIDLAVKYDARLTIVHVLTHDHPSSEMTRMLEAEHLDEPVPAQENTSSGTYVAVGQYLRGAVETKEIRIVTILGEQILKTASKTAREAGVKNVATLIRDGDYANNILDVADTVDADMIVLGRRGT